MTGDVPNTAGMPASLIGRVIDGKLELVSELGRGAMGVVYRARHRALEKTVAIKVLSRDSIDDPERVRRFKAEARAASRLEHPNSLQILDFGVDGADGLLYIVMELLAGENLETALQREGKLPTARAASIMLQVLGALAAAHENGVLHRDLKPANIMLLNKRDDDGEQHDFVKVCDFGLAKILDSVSDSSGAPLTKQGTVFGTPAYMSPEQARGDPLDGRSDLYSAGVIMYHMLVGRPPFAADSVIGLLMKHITAPVPPPREVTPGFDPALEAVILRALEKDREARFPTARDMRSAIKACILSVNPAVLSAPMLPEVDDGRLANLLEPSVSRTLQASVPARLPSGKRPRWPLVLAVAGGVVALALAVTFLSRPDGKKLAVSLDTPQVHGHGEVIPKEAALPAAIDHVERPNREAPPATVSKQLEPAVSESDAGIAAAPSTSKRPPRRAAATAAGAGAGGKDAAAGVVPDRGRWVAVVAPSDAGATVHPPPPPPAAERPHPDAGVAAAREKEVEVSGPRDGRSPGLPGVGREKPLGPRGRRLFGGSTEVNVDIVGVSIGGGVSLRRTQEALRRHEPGFQRCLAAGLAADAGAGRGALDVKAKVEVDGRLRGVKIHGDPTSALLCVTRELERVRLPAPDTGATAIRFNLSYEVK